MLRSTTDFRILTARTISTPTYPKDTRSPRYDSRCAVGGYLDVPMPEGYERRVFITKLHMEEDAGKTKLEPDRRLVDFNRCGVPLIEMVTGPTCAQPMRWCST